MKTSAPAFSTEIDPTLLAGAMRPSETAPPPSGHGESAAAAEHQATVSSRGTVTTEFTLSPATSYRHGSGLNPLVGAAAPLLNLIAPLRAHTGPLDVEALRLSLARAMKQFEAVARTQEIDSQSTAIARYALCTLLDETIAATAWGGGGVWASHSLLASFHNETWGGEKFFQLLQRLAQTPEEHLDLLELCYLCLALGFEGRYRVAEGGAAQLDALRERLQKIIQLHRGPHASPLSPRWEPSEGKAATLFQDVPVWWIAAIVGFLIVSVRIAFNHTLDSRTDPLVKRMYAISLRMPASTPPPPMVAGATGDPAPPGLAMQLAPEIAYGLVRVEEKKDETIVVLPGGVFASGSAEVSLQYRPIIERVGIALKGIEGGVSVVGHTDDQPSRQARFPSNGELSLARAEAVVALLAQQLPTPGRLQAEGRGESEPLVPNTSTENRSRNRRVEIRIRTFGGAP